MNPVRGRDHEDNPKTKTGDNIDKTTMTPNDKLIQSRPASNGVNPDFSQNIPQPEAPKRSFRAEAWETIRFILIALAVVIPIRLYIAQPFIVSGASMDPTFANGQYLIVDEISYRVTDPVRGDVVIFKYPKDPKKYFIKRIIGLPGETLIINEEGKVFVKRIGEESLTLLTEPYVAFTKGDAVEITLGADEYFMMGDNRAGSYDSRAWGAVKRDLLVGKALVRLFPVTTVDLLPGQFRQ